MRRWWWGLGWLLLLLGVADWVGLRAGVLRHPPSLLALIVGGAIAAFAARLAQVVWNLYRGRRRKLEGGSEIILLGGLLLALLGGMANWLLSLQGFVILSEREAVRLHGGTQLQSFEAGPLARLEEMGLFLALDEVDLVPEGDAAFYPASRLRIWRESEAPVGLDVSPRKNASTGRLRFHQGAFGFAPRIVILEGEETIFDRIVPFTTERRETSGISFAGSFTIQREKLDVEGHVDLASLDEAMRGHATLALTVSREGAVLGRGSLLPGHFAEISSDYRVGFAGLEQWSEIVISRRNYGQVVLAGGALVVVGAILWPLAHWRGR